MAERINSEQSAVRLEMRGICKSFGATVALDDVGVRVAGGQVLAFVGENFTGKSGRTKTGRD